MHDYKSVIDNSLTGKVLVANPYCSFGDVFDKSILFVAAHSKSGAFGLVINKYIRNMDIKKLFKIKDIDIDEINKPVLSGGPMDQERNFIIHTPDYDKNIIFAPENNICISSNKDIIKDISNGLGPKKYSFIKGYTGWGAGQIELEIKNNYWQIIEASENLIFSEAHHKKWLDALSQLGISYDNFSSQIAHC